MSAEASPPSGRGEGAGDDAAQPVDAIARAHALLGSASWPDVRGVPFGVVGLGVSGVAAANALARLGADVHASDDQPEAALQGALGRLDRRVRTRLGAGYIARPGEIAVVSPGLSAHGAAYRRVAASAAGVIGEVELWSRLDRPARGGRGHRVIAITGTDGKTTTTMLVDHLLRSAGRATLCAGNIGEPLCNHIGRLGDEVVVVAEVSEFQLATTTTFAPDVLVLTNVADDHLDWFGGDRDAYVASMTDVAGRAGVGDHLIVNAHDPAFAGLWQRARADAARPAITLFSARTPAIALAAALDTADVAADLAFACDEGALVALLDATQRARVALEGDLGADAGRPMRGVHNLDNALAAAAAVWRLGVPLAQIAAGLRTFALPPHRLEPAGEVLGVRFIDDSKATNPHAAIHGLRATPRGEGERLVWIAGGSEKDADFGELAELVAAEVDEAVLIGATAERIAAALASAGFPAARVTFADEMHAAVARAFERCGPRGVVLLSPACASFGLFQSYRHRGEVYKDAVARLGAAVSGCAPASEGAQTAG